MVGRRCGDPALLPVPDRLDHLAVAQGAGGLAIGGWLIALTGVPVRWIARRSAGLFFLSAAVSGLALVGSGLELLVGASGPHDFLRVVLPTILAASAIAAVAALPRIVDSTTRAPRWIRAISAGVRDAQHTTFNRHASWRLLGAVGYLGFDVGVLWVSLRAVGAPPSVPVVTLGYSIGYIANSLPIPGGVGVLDAGLTGALALYGVSPVHAAAAVLVYHAIAFWVPGLGGVVAYLKLRPQLLNRARPAPAPISSKTPDPLREGGTMTAVALMLKPIHHGWAVALTNGRELMRFTGLCAKRRAIRYIATSDLGRAASHVY